MIYLLDTDILTLAQRGKHDLPARIAAARAPDEVVIPIVSRVEVLRGRLDGLTKAADGEGLLRAQELLRLSEAFLSSFRVLAFDAVATEMFDRLRDDKRVKKCGRNDLLNACIALANSATLVTRNTKDYANVPGLKLENWAD